MLVDSRSVKSNVVDTLAEPPLSLNRGPYTSICLLALKARYVALKGFQISIRGRKVEPLPIQMGMKHTDIYEYRPRQLQKDESVPSDYTGGYL